ncbi:hypothetical protein EVAR_70782_1 [Eumeta japonica]|uniref:Uncharacterized protein n=1 Tax=Eumeta variegata TaxID=151549 RepID=A0A4C1SF33_EUMVA|nr:hypothetical protein EVAR_70782_1 [Eumeta japonica]
MYFYKITASLLVASGRETSWTVPILTTDKVTNLAPRITRSTLSFDAAIASVATVSAPLNPTERTEGPEAYVRNKMAAGGRPGCDLDTLVCLRSSSNATEAGRSRGSGVVAGSATLQGRAAAAGARKKEQNVLAHEHQFRPVVSDLVKLPPAPSHRVIDSNMKLLILSYTDCRRVCWRWRNLVEKTLRNEFHLFQEGTRSKGSGPPIRYEPQNTIIVV